MANYKAKINGEDYPLKDGFIISKELNETLDSGTIQFSVVNEIVDVESFDEIEIFDDSATPKITTKKMKVDSGYDEIISFSPTEDREYVLNLFSKTKDLERITLPNLSITKTTKDNTVYDYIYRYLNLYLPKVRRRTSGSAWAWENKYGLSLQIVLYFNTVKCPEFQWNNPTLREVLTDLMSTKNCIPIINNNNEIDLIDLTLPNSMGRSAINTSNLTSIRSSFTSSDYVSDLTINMKNALGKTKTTVVEYKSLRSINSGEITDTNAVFTTNKPIYNIIECKVYHHYANFYYEYDITNLIKESQEWNLLKTSYLFNKGTAYNLKACNLKFTRGQKTIDGWGTITEMKVDIGQVGKTSNPTIGWIVRYISQTSENERGTSVSDVRNINVKLVYETIDEESLHVGRYLPSKHYDNRIFDNQSNSYVDTNQQTVVEYIKANRLSNVIKTIYGVYQNESDIPKLGDYLDDYILYQSKVEYWDDEFKFEGMLIRHYVLKDYFTGVQARKRSWAIASGSEALTRIDIFKYYIEASFNRKYDAFSSGELTLNAYDMMSSLLTNYSKENLKWACISTFGEFSGKFPTSVVEDYAIDLHSSALGKSLVFSFAFTDNYSAGDYAEASDNLLTNNLYPYGDSVGEFKKIQITFTDFIDPIGSYNFTYPNAQQEYWVDETNNQRYCYARMPSESTWNDNIVPLSRSKPKITNAKVVDDELVDIIDINIKTFRELWKDQREITAGTMQLEFCSDTEDIIITDEFVRRNKFVATEYREKFGTGGETIEADIISLRLFDNAPTPTTALLGKGRLYSNGWYLCELDENNQPAWVYKGVADGKYFTYQGHRYYFSHDYFSLHLDDGTPLTNQYIKSDLKLYVSRDTPRVNDMEYLPATKTLLTDAQWDYTINTYNSGQCGRLHFVFYNLPQTYNSFYLCDSNDKVLLAVNQYIVQDGIRYANIYFNVLKSRDTNIYNASGEVVGTIQQ